MRAIEQTFEHRGVRFEVKMSPFPVKDDGSFTLTPDKKTRALIVRPGQLKMTGYTFTHASYDGAVLTLTASDGAALHQPINDQDVGKVVFWQLD